MAKKGSKVTPELLEIRKRNLLDWKQDHPEGGNLRHGMYSVHMRERFSDARTSEGRQLKAILKELVEDIGGQGGISAGQRMIIDTSIRPKLITLLCIADWVDRQKQESIIDEKGELAKCLSTNYLAFTNSLRLDLVALYSAMNSTKPSRVPSIEQIIAGGGKGKE